MTIQNRRGTASEVDALTPEEGEVVVDLDRKTAKVGTEANGNRLPSGRGTSAYLSAAQTIAGNTTQETVAWDATKYDDDNAFDTSTGKWTAPNTGRYRVTAQITWNSTIPVDTRTRLKIINQTSGYRPAANIAINSASKFFSVTVTKDIHVNAGDVLYVEIDQDSGSSVDLFIGESYSYWTIRAV